MVSLETGKKYKMQIEMKNEIRRSYILQKGSDSSLDEVQ